MGDLDDVSKLKEVISKGQLRGKGIVAFEVQGGKVRFFLATKFIVVTRCAVQVADVRAGITSMSLPGDVYRRNFFRARSLMSDPARSHGEAAPSTCCQTQQQPVPTLRE